MVIVIINARKCNIDAFLMFSMNLSGINIVGNLDMKNMQKASKVFVSAQLRRCFKSCQKVYVEDYSK